MYTTSGHEVTDSSPRINGRHIRSDVAMRIVAKINYQAEVDSIECNYLQELQAQVSLLLYHALHRYYSLSEFNKLSSLNLVATFAESQ